MIRSADAPPSGELPFWAGVDVGASATKVVLLNQAGEVVGRAVLRSGVDYAARSRLCLEQALEPLGLDPAQLRGATATGYGRHNVPFASGHATEIQCHGRGCFHLLGRAITIVDIGAQDNKVIRVDDRGRRLDFRMNRKCAAGTGSFVEEMALRLALDPGELEPLAAAADGAVELSSFCTVFAKTEVLAHLRRGVPVERIVRGAFASVVQRVLEMAELPGEVVLTGGVVAHNPTVAALMEERLGRPVTVPPHPQFTGALGAAWLARK